MILWLIQATDNNNPAFQSPILSANHVASHNNPLSNRYSIALSVVHVLLNPSLEISLLISS